MVSDEFVYFFFLVIRESIFDCDGCLLGSWESSISDDILNELL